MSNITTHIQSHIDSLSNDANLIRTFTMKDGVTLKDFYVQSVDRADLSVIWAECSHEDPIVFIREEFQEATSSLDNIHSLLSLI